MAISKNPNLTKKPAAKCCKGGKCSPKGKAKK